MIVNKIFEPVWKYLKQNIQIGLLVLLPIAFGLFEPNFLSISNFNNILDLSSILIITALGFTFIMEMGAIDLSVEGNMALASIIAASCVKNMTNDNDFGIFAVLIAIIVSAFFGFLNGVINSKVKIPSFMVTLGMQYILTGACVVITQGQYIIIRDDFARFLGQGKIGIIPMTMVIAILVAIVIWILSEKSKFGRYVLAIGGDESIAKNLGINIARTKIGAFTLAGATFGLAGSLIGFKLGAGDSFSSYGYTFESISACVIGGIAISGGIGKTSKTIIGAIIITVLRSGMVFLNVQPNVQAGILGLIIIVAVALTIDRSKLGMIR